MKIIMPTMKIMTMIKNGIDFRYGKSVKRIDKPAAILNSIGAEVVSPA